MGTNHDTRAAARGLPRRRVAPGPAAWELLLVVGLALAGVLLASLATLAPWYAGSPWAPAPQAPVTGFQGPADPGTRG